jgi:general secretion pathway protein K
MKRQQGSALIVALLIVALAVILATAMAVRLHNSIRFESNIIEESRLHSFSEGSLLWAKALLLTNATHTEPLPDNLPQFFNRQPIEGGVISASLEDGQRKLNINNLTVPDYFALFIRLAKNTIPTLSSEQANQMAESILDHLMSSSHSGENMLNYFWNVDELALIPFFSPEKLALMKPYLIALPDITPLNISTTSDKMLLSLSSTMLPEDVSRILADRTKFSKITSVSDFIQQEKLDQKKIPTNLLILQSQYFELSTMITQGNKSLNIYTLLHRLTENNQTQMVVILEK